MIKELAEESKDRSSNTHGSKSHTKNYINYSVHSSYRAPEGVKTFKKIPKRVPKPSLLKLGTPNMSIASSQKTEQKKLIDTNENLSITDSEIEPSFDKIVDFGPPQKVNGRMKKYLVQEEPIRHFYDNQERRMNFQQPQNSLLSLDESINYENLKLFDGK